MNKVYFSVFLIALLIASCSSMPPEATEALTATHPNTPIPPPTATLPPSSMPTEIRSEIVKCEELGHSTTGILFKEGVVITYFGTVGENDQAIGMTLTYSSSNVEGRFFYPDKYKDKSDEMKLMGCLEKGRDFTLTIYENDDSILTVIHGQFPETDPKGAYQGDQLVGEVITGTWEDQVTTKNSSIYLTYELANRGTLDHQYEWAGVEDDQLIDNAAQELLSAVARDDKETISKMIEYPVAAIIDGERKEVTNQTEFLKNYEKIFTDEFKAILADARPHHMWVKLDFIMLGSGDIWFNKNGKIVTINNYGG